MVWCVCSQSEASTAKHFAQIVEENEAEYQVL